MFYDAPLMQEGPDLQAASRRFAVQGLAGRRGYRRGSACPQVKRLRSEVQKTRTEFDGVIRSKHDHTCLRDNNAKSEEGPAK